jgi:two-component system, sporulation sensor kinase D
MIHNSAINTFELRKFIRIILLLLAIFISILTLYLSQRLVNKIAIEEKKKMEIWADAERILSDPESQGDLGFHLKIIQSNETIPAILVSETGKIIQFIHISEGNHLVSDEYLKAKIELFKEENDPIKVPIDENTTYLVYYGKSSVLKQLEYYPWVVLGIVGLFILVSYSAFSYSTRSEQNQVWVGLAKETAHQLGTPISSLMGWVTCIENEIIPENAAEEMKKDVDRLNTITERFSKIGSEPVLETLDFVKVVGESLKYMKSRIGKGVVIDAFLLDEPVWVKINVNLFQWVIENLVKNSVDAMDGEGNLSCVIEVKGNKVWMDISDTGKGITRSQSKDIFKPGFTTKKRGWGLGLSLAKRIVEDYHKGQIFVKESIPFKKTTIRVGLNLSELVETQPRNHS